MRHQYGISVTPYFSTMPLEYGDVPIATYALLTWLGFLSIVTAHRRSLSSLARTAMERWSSFLSSLSKRRRTCEKDSNAAPGSTLETWSLTTFSCE